MRPDRKSIRKAFSRAASTYDAHSVLQRDVACAVAGLLQDVAATKRAPTPGPQSILDVGCGTGLLTALVKEAFPAALVYGCDIATAMLEEAGRKAGTSESLAACACESLGFDGSAFDAVVSSLTYQWSVDLTSSFTEAARVLAPGGLLVFSTLGPATLHELRESLDGHKFMDYEDVGSITRLLDESGLEVLSVESKMIGMTYAGMRTLLRTLKKIGASVPASSGHSLSPRRLKEAEEVYAKKFAATKAGDGGDVRIKATYEVIFASAQKPMERA